MAVWADSDDASTHWPDAPSLTPEALADLLAAAQEQCERFAPALAEADEIPARYTLAVVAQAREIYTAGQRGESDVIGVGDYAIRARPLTAHVRQLLRPRRARPRIG